MKYLLDTNICIAFLNGHDEKVQKAFMSHSQQDLSICSVVKAELFYGARNSSRVERNLFVLEGFLQKFESLSFDDKAAEHYGFIRAFLKRSGQLIGANDLLIAAIALAVDLTLVTRNKKEFIRIPSLRVEEW